MPKKQFLVGPPEDAVQAECPVGPIVLTYLNRTVAEVETLDDEAMAYVTDYMTTRGWEDGGLVP